MKCVNCGEMHDLKKCPWCDYEDDQYIGESSRAEMTKKLKEE